MTAVRSTSLWLVVALALATRTAFILHSPNRLTHGDSGSFDSIAWNVASEGRYALQDKPTAHRTPSYPLFLAAIYKLAGHSYRAAFFAQALLGILALVQLMLLVKRLATGPWAPISVGLIAAFYPFSLYYEASLLADSFIAFALVTTVYTFVRFKETPGSAGAATAWAGSAVVLALAKTVFVPFFALCWMVEAALMAREAAWRRRGAALLIALVIFSLPLLAWGHRNKQLFGRWLLDTHGGITFLECVVYYDVNKRGEFATYFREHPELHLGTNEAERDEAFFGLVREFTRTHPKRYARQILSNVKDFWRFYPRQDIQFREGTRKITIVSLLTEPFLILLGLWGLWVTRRQWRTLYPVYVAMAALTAAHALSCAQMRYRYPLMPLLIVFAVIGLEWGCERWKRR